MANTWKSKNNHFSNAINWFEIVEKNIYDRDLTEYAYILRVMYTCKLNSLKLKLTSGNGIPDSKDVKEFADFVGYNLWGKEASSILPGTKTSGNTRSRFDLPFPAMKNIVMRKLGLKEINIEPGNNQVKNISGENKEDLIKFWFTIGLVSEGLLYSDRDDCYYIISNNRNITDKLSVSIDNYLVSLSNLYMLYDKVNLSIMKSNEKDPSEEDSSNEIKKFYDHIKEYEEYNHDAVECARYIVSNPDCILELKEYCSRKGPKKGPKKENSSVANNTSYIIYENFFNNVIDFINEKLGTKYAEDTFMYFKFNNVDSEKVDMALLYAQLVEYDSNDDINDLDKNDTEWEKWQGYYNDMIESDIIRDDTNYVKNLLEEYSVIPEIEKQNNFRKVSMYIMDIKRMENNLLNMAYNIQFINCSMHDSILDREQIEDMCNLYRDAKVYLECKYEHDHTAQWIFDTMEDSLKKRYKIVYNSIYGEYVFKKYIENKDKRMYK